MISADFFFFAYRLSDVMNDGNVKGDKKNKENDQKNKQTKKGCEKG